MPIVFAENFEYDKEGSAADTSINQRYPGSNLTVTAPGAVALGNRDGYLQTGKQLFNPEINTRFEVRLETGQGDSGSVPSALNLFGLELFYTSNQLTVQGVNLPDLSAASSLHFILEKTQTQQYALIVLVDDVVVVTPTILDTDWVYNSWLGRAHGQGGSGYIGHLPTLLRSVTVAVDTPVGTRIATPTFTKRNLVVDSEGNWTYSDLGYIEDTDKQDPTVEAPYIAVADDTPLVIDVPDLDPGTYTNLYMNVRTEKPLESLSINDVVQPAGAQLRTIPVMSGASTVTVETVPQEGKSNNLGLRFFGERDDLITYAALSTAVGFTAGTVNSGTTTVDRWLHINLDGQEMFVARGPVRWNVSWNYIYARGLVYGVDGPGQDPTGNAVNQFRTVEIAGVTYLVRLLQGLDTNPGTSTTGNYIAGTNNSEWSRIFYPLCVNDPAIPVGIERIASYTMLQLQMSQTTGNQNLGRNSWCQEAAVDAPPSFRVTRGNTGPSYVIRTDRSYTDTSYGWRPVLVRLT